jgi:hypothetical protein
MIPSTLFRPRDVKSPKTQSSLSIPHIPFSQQTTLYPDPHIPCLHISKSSKMRLAVLASLGLIPSALSLQNSPPEPLLSYPSWAYLGCIASSDSSYLILSSFTLPPSLPRPSTIETCLDACAASRNIFAALAAGFVSPCFFLGNERRERHKIENKLMEANRSCLCASTIGTIDAYIVVADTVCEVPCAGVLEESCGGNVELGTGGVTAVSLYQRWAGSESLTTNNISTALLKTRGLRMIK